MSDETKKQWTTGGISAAVAFLVAVPTIIFASGATWEKVRAIEVRQERVENLYNQKANELSTEMKSEFARLAKEYEKAVNDIRLTVNRIEDKTEKNGNAIANIEGRLSSR